MSIGAGAELDRVSAIQGGGHGDPPLTGGVAHLDVEALVQSAHHSLTVYALPAVSVSRLRADRHEAGTRLHTETE